MDINVLAAHDGSKIVLWLVNEPIESLDAHIKNGYPALESQYKAGNIHGEIVSVPEEDSFAFGKYEVSGGTIRRKES